RSSASTRSQFRQPTNKDKVQRTRDKGRRTGDKATWRWASMSLVLCTLSFVPGTSLLPGSGRRLGLQVRGGQPLQDVVHNPVLDGLPRGHELVPIGVLFDLLQRVARVPQKDLVEDLFQALDLLDMQEDLRGSAL